MLPKKKRVTKEAFQILIKEGKTLSTPLFLFHYKKSESPQYVFVAPKKVFKNAVKRNKHRRIGYNILRFIPLKTGAGIFVYKKQAIETKTEDLKKDIVFILKKVGFLSE